MSSRTLALSRKPHKYHAVPTVVDGIRFDSKKEARRWQELRLLERAGEIEALERQPRFPLYVRGVKLGEYRGDFQYVARGVVIIEDVKGYDNRLSRWKRKHMKAQYRIEVKIV